MSAVSMRMTSTPGSGRTSARREALNSKPALRRQMPAEDATQEKASMQSGRSREKPPTECDQVPEIWAGVAGSAWPSAAAERVDAKSRLTSLAQTLESDVIPRLVGAHAHESRAPVAFESRDVESFVGLLRQGTEAEVDATMQALRRRGMTVEAIFLQVFGPSARLLGEMWATDRCDFSTVTICLGRLQRLLREWSPAFGTEVEHPPNGRRILLAQHPDEHHSFGLSMVAEFFRRDGWEVLGGVGGAVHDPSAQVSRDWFDVVGFSIGVESRIDWLKERIAQVRAATRNRSVVVLVGGPLFVLDPAWAKVVGADAMGNDGGKAPSIAEQLLASRLPRR